MRIRDANGTTLDFIVMRYEYQGNVLSQITSLDPHEQHEYATLKFDYEGDTNLVCTTDRGKRATYRFGKVKKGPSLLTHISSPSYRNTHIDYSKTYLLRLEEGKQRNYLGIYKGFPSSSSSSYFRVHELCFPIGEKDALETVYTIEYTPAVAGIRTGLTIAKRKDGSSIHYHVGKNLLVEKIEFYDKERKLRKQNIYTWQAPGSIFVPNRSHWLQSYETQDENGALLIRKTFHYDRFGNVEKELLQGDLTGDGTIDTLTTRRTFSKEGRHLLLSEEIEDKTLTTYTYLPNTNLPVSKILRDREKVRQRTFWEYDSCNNLIKKILDDGNRKKREDLRDVTERRITCYILKTEAPHLHLPHAIEERYLEDNEEKLLKTTYFEYDLDDNITLEKCEDPQGKILYTREKTYDEQGNVLSETNPLGATAISTYTSKGQLQTYIDFSGRLTEERDYDKRGRLKETRKVTDTDATHIARYHYDCFDLLKQSQDYLGHVTIYEYDLVTGKPIRIEEPSVSSKPVIHKHIYNAAGDTISYTDPCGHTTKYQYNSFGSITGAYYPNASSEHWRYDKHGRLTKHIDPDGVETSYTHDYADRVLTKTISFESKQASQEVFTYNAFHVLEEKDAEGIITSHIYDKAGRKIQQTKQDRVLAWEYDPLNQIKTFCEENGDNTRLTHFSRDATGEILEKTVTDKHNHLLSRISYAYDPQRRLTSITRYPEEGETLEKYTYDGFSRLTSHEDPSGAISTTLYVDETTPYTIEQDPLGIKTKKTFDAHHNLIRKEQFDPLGTFLQKEERDYDPCGRLIKHREAVYHRGVFTKEETLRYTYTPRGQLETITLAADTNEAKTTEYTYTPSGLVHTKTLPDGTSLSYDYIPLGRLKTLTSSDGSIFHIFNYNKRGDLLEAIDKAQDIKVTRIPDAFGNILEETLSTGLTIVKTYDHFDRPLSLTLPDGSQIIHLYDALRLRATHRTSLTGEYTHSYLDYDLAGNLLVEKIGDLDTITHTTRIKDRKKSKSCSYFSEECCYNARQELVSSTKNGVASTYVHDPLSHLIAEPGYTYEVDSIHNLVEKNGTPAQINCLNQLGMLGSIACLYNNNGDLVEKASEHGKVTYAYNPLHELISAIQESTRIEFTNDPLGRILKRVKSSPTGTETELYLYNGNEEIGAFNEDGTCKNLCIIGFGKEPVAIELNGEIFAPITDSHRNVEMLIAYPSGTITHTYRHSAFGEPLLTQETLFNPWRFAGKRLDPDLGIVSFGKRFYDPELTRWLTPDPAGFTDSINLYQYVLHNPFRYLDPHGESLLGYLCGIAQILAGGIVMATGIALECATFGGYTFALGFHEAAGLALMTSGCAQALSNAKDVSFLNQFHWQHTLFEGVKESGVATETEEEKKKPPFDGSELGNDPAKCPGEGFEWKGNGTPESGKGNWVKKKDGIVESLHPDFNHPPPIPPHWDYVGPGFEEGVRLYLDGNWGAK